MQGGAIATLKDRRLLLVAASAFVAGALYLAAVMVAGLGDVKEAWRQAGPACVIGALAASVAAIALRYLRWHLYLRLLGHRLPGPTGFAIYAAGLSLTTVPGKIGELVRSVFLRQHGVPYPKSIAAFLADRLSDLTGVLLVAALLSWLVFPAARVLAIPALVLCAALAVLRVAHPAWLLRLVSFAPAKWRIRMTLAGLVSVLDHLRACLSPAVFGFGLAVGALAYSVQGLALAGIVRAMGGSVSAEAAVLSFLLSTLGGAASMLPAGLGSMDAALVALLSHFGAPAALAVAATILIRLTTLWFAVALGLVCLIVVQPRTPGPDAAERDGLP